MTECKLSDLEEYSDQKFLVKKVYEGAQSKAMLLHLLPGQQVPVHPHDGFEVILFPQKGSAVLVWEDGSEAALTTGTVYYEGISPVFGLQNRGQDSFQMLVTLARIAGTPA